MTKEMVGNLKTPEHSEDEKEKATEPSGSEEVVENKRDLQKDYDELFDKYLRLQAEFDNFRKRLEKEKADFQAYATEKLIGDLLPVLDHLELAIQHSRDTESIDVLSEGVELVLRQLKDLLEKRGLHSIESIGQSFDPNFHEALSQIESADHEENTVVEEFQKGYILSGRMLRPSKVTVSKKPDTPDKDPDE